MNNALLSVKNICVSYGAISAVKDITFQVNKGEIVSLIGSNGAGKTTVLKTISGILRPMQGHIEFANKEITYLSPHLIVKQGLSHVPEGRGIFLNLSVKENLDLGAWNFKGTPSQKDLDYVFSLFPRLYERKQQNAGTLSGGEQQMLAIARALMAHPTLLILDEPSLGLAPQMIDKIFEIIVKINKEGQSILLVEQNAYQALNIAHIGIVLETGSITAIEQAKTLLQSEHIKNAYLGG
ncbi:MAG: ABC transporter ATP-binding protein [Bacteriovoracaceae bacterium]|nr:ABC transporter ATP-binding protein [Bacteriovoracaceae bacterium]